MIVLYKLVMKYFISLSNLLMSREKKKKMFEIELNA